MIKNSNAEKRDAIRDRLHQAGIQTSVHYPSANRFSIYKQYDNGGLENSEYVTDNEITLPMYARLSDDQIDYITGAIERML